MGEVGTEEGSAPIRILFVEDQLADAERALYHLKRAGVACEWRRVETEQALASALQDFSPHLVLSDFSLPRFDGLSALRMAQQFAPAVPFLFLSGTIGEERAIQALHAGAVDYVLKDNLARLVPAIRRAITEAESKVAQARQEAQIARLHRVLRMQSGVNGLVLRIRDRNELLRETCRLAVAEGGYVAALALAQVPPDSSIQPVAWNCADAHLAEDLNTALEETVARESSIVASVIASGREFVSNDTALEAARDELLALLAAADLHSLVVLPLLIDGTCIASLVLVARDAGVVGEEELAMLRDVAGNLSFGLQYLQRESRARFLSHFDPQTGLAKRPLFCERMHRLVTRSPDPSRRHAVVVFDIEKLGAINESFGRRTGDLLLEHVAERLKQASHSSQLAHFGGGTFAMVCTPDRAAGKKPRISGRGLAEQLFGEPFQIEGRTIPVTARTGTALWPEDAAEAMPLVQNAEAALQHARATGERHLRYDPAASSSIAGQLALEHRLRFAFERNEFELHYQPKVSITSRRVQGAEALLRWRSPADGLLSAAAFLGSLETSGLIVPVSNWVVEQAARDCRRWMEAGLPPVRIAVNIPPPQLRQPDFATRFLAAVAPWSTPEWDLDIEITEGALHENAPDDVEKLRRLREAGVRVAIDDFGTGYSSLSRLATLPIDTLKIDRSFVAASLTNPSGGSLVRTIIALAGALEMTAIAEGVEKVEELELLRQLGCDQSQGFLHSAALPAAEFVTVLQDGRGALLRPAAHGARQGLRARRQ